MQASCSLQSELRPGFRCWLVLASLGICGRMEVGTPAEPSTDGWAQQAGDGALRTMGAKEKLNESQLAEKLEKSETGRKKLRQAIAILKEKLDATSQVLEVNESLRQEAERERQRADTEKKKAELEKLLKEKLERENATVKEQLLQVLQRLGRVEDTQKAGQEEVARIRSEVKEAVGGISAALEAVEATKGLCQTLERTLHAKVNGAVQSSTRASAIAQSGQATSSTAQSAALAAQSLAKAVQKEVQSLVSQVASLQKQGSNLTLHMSSLQQESQLRGPGTPLNSPEPGETTSSLGGVRETALSGAVSPTSSSLPTQGGMVLSKSQCEKQRAPHSADERETLAPLVPVVERPLGGLASSGTGLPPRGGPILSRSQIQTDGKSHISSSQIHHLARSPRNGAAKTSTRLEHTSNLLISQPVSTNSNKGPVAIITGVDSILNPTSNCPQLNPPAGSGLTPSLYITGPSGRDPTSQRSGETPMRKSTDAIKELGSSGKKKNRSFVKRGRADVKISGSTSMVAPIDSRLSEPRECNTASALISTGNMIARPGLSIPGTVAQLNGSSDTPACMAGATLSEGRPMRNFRTPDLATELVSVSPGSADSRLSSKLLKSIAKMFKKEAKNRSKMEEKLMELQGILESTGGLSVVGVKRKRAGGKSSGDGITGKSDKKKSLGPKSAKKRKCHVEPPHTDGMNTKGPSEEGQIQDGENQGSGSGEVPQGKVFKGFCEYPGGEGSLHMDEECQEVLGATGGPGFKSISDVKPSNPDPSKMGSGWDTDPESTDDDIGEDWWAKKVLLSPTLPDIVARPHPPSPVFLQTLESDHAVQHVTTSTEEAFPESSCNTGSLLEQPTRNSASVDAKEHASDVLNDKEKEMSNTGDSTSVNVKQSLQSTPVHCNPLLSKASPMSLQDITNFLDDLPNVTHPPILDMEHDFHSSENIELGPLTQPLETTSESAASKDTLALSSVACQTASIVGDLETFISGENLLASSEVEINDICETKISNIESTTKLINQQETQSLTNDIQQQFLSPLRVSRKMSSTSSPDALDLDKETEKCRDTKNSQHWESSSVRIGTAFKRTKTCLYDALNKKSTCKLQSGGQLGTELAAVAADCSLSGEEVLGLFALSLVEVPVLQHDDFPTRASSLHGSLSDSITQVVAVVEQVVRCETLSALLLPGHDGIDVILKHLRRFLVEDQLWSGGVDAEIALSLSSHNEHRAHKQHLHCACEEESIERAVTGGKILAGLCQAYSRLDTLEAFMYTSLRWCLCDTCWLVAVFSSFAFICGKSLWTACCGIFSSKALRAVVAELLVSMNGSEEKSRTNPQHDIKNSTQLVSRKLHYRSFIHELHVLQDSLEQQTTEGLNTVLNQTLVAMLQLLSSPQFLEPKGSLLTNTATERMGKVSRLRTICTQGAIGRGWTLKNIYPTEALEGSLRATFVNCCAMEEYAAGDNGLQDQFWDICQALELISVQLGWKWTYNDLIVGHLWGLVTPGAPQGTIIAIIHLLGLLGRLGVMEDGTELPGVDSIRDRLRGIAQQVSFSEAAQAAAAQGLVLLSH